MGKKINVLSRALVYALIVCSFISCGGNKVKKVNVDNQMAVSLFADTITIGSLMSRLDSSFYQYIKVADNGDIYAYFADSVENAVKSEDVFGQIPDVSFNMVETFPIENIPAPPVPIITSYTMDELFTMPFSYDGYQITSVNIKDGEINIKLSTDMNFVDTLILFTQNIILENGQPLEIEMLMKDDVQNINIPLRNCKVIPNDGNIVFSATLAVCITESIGGDYNFDISGAIENLEFKTIDGAIDNMYFDFIGSQPISFGFANLDGDFKLLTPEFNIKYHNSFGFKAEGLINELYLTSVDGSVTDLKRNESIYIELHNTDGGYETISDLDDQLTEKIDVLGNYNLITFDGNIVVGCDELEDYLISDESHIDIIADLTLPLKFNIEELRYRDTMDFNLDFSDEDLEVEGVNVNDVFDEIEFKLAFKNKMPFQITPQIYMAYDNYIIDSLFSGNTVIHGCFDGTLTEDVLTVTIAESKLDNVRLANKLYIDLKLSSLSNDVVMNTNDYFDLKLGVKTKTSEINLENLNL